MNTDNRDRKILVSACLYGECTRYDGKCKPTNNDLFETWKKSGVLIRSAPRFWADFPHRGRRQKYAAAGS